MDGQFVATVHFKPNTKNCFVGVPSCWISSPRNDRIIVFEVQRKDGQSVFLSWSGDSSSANDIIELNGFYALKLGLGEGEEVFVGKRRDVPAIETVHVEPVSVDDWEILELHAEYIQNNLLNQVRTVWNNQVLPVWVNQSVCILIQISQLSPLFDVGILVNSTELHITPKMRKSHVEPMPVSLDSVAYSSLHTETSKSKEKSSVRHAKAKDVVPSLKHQEGKRDSKDLKSDHKGSMTSISNKSRQWDFIKVTVRVHPWDTLKVLENLNSTDQTNFNNSDIRTLLLQPTNVFVLSQTCGFTRERQTNPVLFGKLINIIEVDDSSKTKSKEDKQNQLKLRKQCSVKVVILDYLLDYAEEGSDLKRLLTKLIIDQVGDAIFVPTLVRRNIQSPVTSRVIIEIRKQEAKTLKPTSIMLFPLSEVMLRESEHQNTKAKEKDLNSEIVIWLDSICSLSCPLILTDKLVITLPISGINHDFLVQSSTKSETKDDSSSVITLITPATKLNVKWDVLVKDRSLDAIVSTDWDTTAFGSPSFALGGFDILVKECQTYLKMCLNLGQLASHLRVGLRSVGGVLLISGSSGCGKSSLARALARDFSESPFFVYTDYIDCKAMKGKRPESVVKSWRKSYAEAHRRHPSIIILDDLDQLVGVAVGPENEIGVGNNYRTKLADTLKELMRYCLRSNTGVTTVVTSKSVSSLCQSLISTQGVHLFQKVIKIPSPNINERIDILKQVILSKPLASSKVIDSKDIDWPSLANRMEGYSPRDLNIVIDRALHLAISKSGSIEDDDVIITQDDIEKACIDFVPVSLRMLNIHKPGDKLWNDVGGLAEIKKALIETLQWPSKYPNLFASCPLPMRSGILLYGAPGTGKTLLAGVVAKECSMNFISIKGPELLSKYIGASEQAVRDLFERAANAKPCIIFFDEFDSLAPRRGHDNTGVTDRVVNQLLTQMDGVEGRKDVYVLAATSRPDLIDPALLRPGRLDKCLFCPLPTAEEREQILRALSQPINLGDDVNLSEIAILCEHFTGADLQGLLYNAQLDAIHYSVGQLYNMDKSTLELDYVICKKETSPTCKLNEDEYKMIHFRNLKDGPEEKDLEYLKFYRQKISCLLSNIENSSTSKSTIIDDEKRGRHQAVVVHQSNLVDALKEMRPSVGPEDRKRYNKIYEAFLKSRGGHFDVKMSLQSLHGNRATLA
ncbi:Peroxisome biosynthesis protein pex1 [Chamberlinius hualienensis]